MELHSSLQDSQQSGKDKIPDTKKLPSNCNFTAIPGSAKDKYPKACNDNTVKMFWFNIDEMLQHNHYKSQTKSKDMVGNRSLHSFGSKIRGGGMIYILNHL